MGYCIYDTSLLNRIMFLKEIMIRSLKWKVTETNKFTSSHWGFFLFEDCAKNIGPLPSLPGDMRCTIAESCTEIDCCVRAAPIHHNFNVYLNVDPCNQQMKFAIDKFQFQLYLKEFEFEFGIEKDVRLLNVVRMKWVQ